ncbi:PIG-L deacetylase family protein [Deinococcus metalli]|nr:PIG-L deacetylase family protein [Deinococcus metalli]
MAVIAHPSDEVFNFGGTLAYYAAQGVKVTVVCATRGEGQPLLGPSDAAAVREHELRESCTALGLPPPVFLDYHDSGGLNATNRTDPLALVNAPHLEIEQRLLAVIAQERPQVLLTFDPRGGNGHPDKLRMFQATCAAFQFSGYLPDPPQRLFLAARSLALMEGLTSLPTGPWVDLDPRQYATAESGVAARIDTRGQRPTVIAAARAHTSQALSRLPEEVLNGVYGVALDWGIFVLAGSRGPLPRWPVEDVFEGL